MGYSENEILDYLSGNDYCLGIVIRDGDGRVQVKGPLQETAKIPHKQVLASHGQVSDPKKALVAIQNAIMDNMESIDTAFIWEIFSQEPGIHSFQEIADSYFGNREAVNISALARKLSGDKDRFQRSGNAAADSIKVYSKEESEEVIRLRLLRAEKAAQREKAAAWLQQALAHKEAEPFPVPPEYDNLVNQAAEYLICGTNSEAVNLLSRTGDRKNARENAITLLKSTARMPADADEFLLANGIHAGFSKNILEYTESLPQDFPKDGRTLIENEIIFSIDDQETREIDDALSCRRDGEDFIVGIYIADPACYVSKDDPLDQVAAERPLSLYLPTTTVKMFPDRLSCDLASLKEGSLRPCLAFTARMTGEGEVLDWSLAPSCITVTRRLTYEEADNIIAGQTADDSLAQPLKDLLAMGDEMRKFRESDGAVILNRPDVRVRVEAGDIQVSCEDQNTPAFRMVAEFMILANHLAAQYAMRNELPVIYRVQDPPSGHVCSVHKYEPYFFDQQVRKMKRTRLSTYPQPHFGLGLDLYIQISSPLRRYADLVMHRQIAAHCMKQPIPYRQEELFTVLDNVDSTSSQNRALQREADNYWLLEYLKRNLLGKPCGATIIRVEGSLVLAELDNYCVRGIVLTRDRPLPGEHLKVTIKEVYPESGRLVLNRN